MIRKIPVTGKQAVKHRTHPQGGGGDTLKVQLKFCSGHQYHLPAEDFVGFNAMYTMMIS